MTIKYSKIQGKNSTIRIKTLWSETSFEITLVDDKEAWYAKVIFLFFFVAIFSVDLYLFIKFICFLY